MHQFNEFCIVIIGLTTVIYTEFSPTEDVKLASGYIMIGLATFGIVINLVYGFIEIYVTQKH